MCDFNDFPCPSLFTEERSEEEYKNIYIKSEVEIVLNEIISNITYGDNSSVTNSSEELNAEVCFKCNSPQYEIERRVDQLYENPPDRLYTSYICPITGMNKYICISCCYDGRKCSFCGISEKLVKVTCDRNVRFHEVIGSYQTSTSFVQTYDTYCPECSPLIIGQGHIDNINIEMCRFCGEDHDSQDCPSGLGEIYGTEFDIVSEEYQPIQEDNEKIKIIKTGLNELMEMLFELSKSIGTGKYLSLTNKLKELYEIL